MTLGDYIKKLTLEEENRYKQAMQPVIQAVDKYIKAKKIQNAEIGQLKLLNNEYGGVDTSPENLKKIKDVYGSVEIYEKNLHQNAEQNKLKAILGKTSNEPLTQTREKANYKTTVDAKINKLSMPAQSIFHKWVNENKVDIYDRGQSNKVISAINDAYSKAKTRIANIKQFNNVISRLTSPQRIAVKDALAKKGIDIKKPKNIELAQGIIDKTVIALNEENKTVKSAKSIISKLDADELNEFNNLMDEYDINVEDDANAPFVSKVANRIMLNTDKKNIILKIKDNYKRKNALAHLDDHPLTYWEEYVIKENSRYNNISEDSQKVLGHWDKYDKLVKVGKKYFGVNGNKITNLSNIKVKENDINLSDNDTNITLNSDGESYTIEYKANEDDTKTKTIKIKKKKDGEIFKKISNYVGLTKEREFDKIHSLPNKFPTEELDSTDIAEREKLAQWLYNHNKKKYGEFVGGDTSTANAVYLLDEGKIEYIKELMDRSKKKTNGTGFWNNKIDSEAKQDSTKQSNSTTAKQDSTKSTRTIHTTTKQDSTQVKKKSEEKKKEVKEETVEDLLKYLSPKQKKNVEYAIRIDEMLDSLSEEQRKKVRKKLTLIDIYDPINERKVIDAISSVKIDSIKKNS